VQDLFAQILHDRHEPVGADVRLGVEQNVLVRARLGELLEHPADALVFDAGVELPVREGARAALAELHVARGVELACLPEALDLLAPRRGVLPALERDGAQPGLGQHQGREQARGAEADHDGAHAVPAHRARRLVLRVGGEGGLGAVRHLEDLVLAASDQHVDRVEQADIRFFAGVDGLFAHVETLDLRLADAQLPGRQLDEPGYVLVGRQGQIVNPNHLAGSFPSFPARRPDDQAHCRL